MSELKAIESATAVIENVYLVYRKSEADKVIAELKHDVEMWIGSYEASRRVNARTESELRYQKYKRCLAMRNMCRYAQYSYSYLMENESCKIRPNNIDFRRYNKKYHFYIRWRNRWLELSEKFKDKETK